MTLWMFFPDPWPKPRHHKRRLLTPAFATLAASRLKPGAIWRLATDCADYADLMRKILDERSAPSPTRIPPAGRPRWEARPITQFEQRGLDAGRPIFDLAYRRVD